MALFISNFAAQSGLSATVGLALLWGLILFGAADPIVIGAATVSGALVLTDYRLFLRHKNGKLHQVDGP